MVVDCWVLNRKLVIPFLRLRISEGEEGQRIQELEDHEEDCGTVGTVEQIQL